MPFCNNCGTETDGAVCPRCKKSAGQIPAPVVPVAVHAAPAMDPLETQLLVDRAKQKSPGFAAVLGFFLPWAAAFYNGKVPQGILFLVVDGFFLLLSLIGIGVFLLLAYGFVGAYVNYNWAKEANLRALEQLVRGRRLHTGPFEAQS